MATNLRSLFTSYQTGALQVKTYLKLGDSERKIDSEIVYEEPTKGIESLQRTLKRRPAPQHVWEKKPEPQDTFVSELFENFEHAWSEIKEVGLRFQKGS
ncbi:hypothetical protein Gasu2_47050 [Galdieria sulphuraria]|nr:hypothetical protein Gasu2_47050 [Galdieria sulphuraria]